MPEYDRDDLIGELTTSMVEFAAEAPLRQRLSGAFSGVAAFSSQEQRHELSSDVQLLFQQLIEAGPLPKLEDRDLARFSAQVMSFLIGARDNLVTAKAQE